MSLGIRTNIAEEDPYIYYLAQWDFVKFDTHCGGFGYLPEDLNRDCYVDILDLGMLAEEWLGEEAAYNCDLFGDDEGIVNLRDFAIFASYWRDDTCGQSNGCGGSDFYRSGTVDFADLRIFAEYWLEPVVTLLSDLNTDGAINFKDVAIFANGWLDNTDWRNWPADNCFEIELPAGDLNDDGIVNLRDFAVLAGAKTLYYSNQKNYYKRNRQQGDRAGNPNSTYNSPIRAVCNPVAYCEHHLSYLWQRRTLLHFSQHLGKLGYHLPHQQQENKERRAQNHTRINHCAYNSGFKFLRFFHKVSHAGQD